MSKEDKAQKMPQSTKMRIRAYHPEAGLVDRLVEQSTELRMGPKEALPKGSTLSLEFNLLSNEDVDEVIEYVRKLKGDLPIVKPEQAPKKSQKISQMLSSEEPLLDLVKTIKLKAKTQEDIISILREHEFMFMTSQALQDMAPGDALELREKDIEKDYQFMVRRYKAAKDPANDKFDFRLVVAIKITGEKTRLVPIYLWGKFSETLKLDWKAEKKINFKKVDQLQRFPPMMDYNERKRWRQEHRKLENKPDLAPSDFYTKWRPYIQDL